MTYLTVTILLTAAAISALDIVVAARGHQIKRATRIGLVCYAAELGLLALGLLLALVLGRPVGFPVLLCLGAAAAAAAILNAVSLFRETDLGLVRLVAVNLVLWVPVGGGMALLWMNLLGLMATC